MIYMILYVVFLYGTVTASTFIALLLNRDEFGKKDNPSTHQLIWKSLGWPMMIYRDYFSKWRL